MANSKAHSDDLLTPKIKPSNTGHAKHPAKKAPMSAKRTQMLGGEQTSDGAAAEMKQQNSRSGGKKSKVSKTETSAVR